MGTTWAFWNQIPGQALSLVLPSILVSYATAFCSCWCSVLYLSIWSCLEPGMGAGGGGEQGEKEGKGGSGLVGIAGA